ncbi:MAG TPA: ATP-dependent Clp protease proteolytic subunit [Acidimicrobiales bacterium]|nr:ATP-dependent Clp protease proteolytic subunit [Acidimicrobiales bacterium]
MTAPRWRPEPGPADEARAQSVRDRLFDQRVVFLWGELDDAAAGQLAAELMTLDATGDEPVQLHIDSPGGTLEAAFCLIDVIDLLGVDLVATCVGQAVGPALGPLAVAHRRQATPHARLRLAEPVASMTGHPRDLDTWAAHHRAQVGRFAERLAAAVGRPVDAVADDLAAGRYLDAQEALDYGLIDEVCGPRARIVPLPGPRLGFRPRP